MTDQTTAPAGVVSSTELGHAPRWYCLSADGMATLCVDEEDAKEVAAESWVLYPQNAPYRAAQMVDASAIATAVTAERERWADAMRAIMCGPVGMQTRDKLASGQATNTPDGRAWLAALSMLDLWPNHQIAGPQGQAHR